MFVELGMTVIVEVLHSGFLDRSDHSFDLAVCPRMFPLHQLVLDAVFLAAHIEHVGEVDCCWPIGIAGRKGELDAIIGENRVNFVRHSFYESDEER